MIRPDWLTTCPIRYLPLPHFFFFWFLCVLWTVSYKALSEAIDMFLLAMNVFPIADTHTSLSVSYVYEEALVWEYLNWILQSL
jgi:hypothetical protein